MKNPLASVCAPEGSGREVKKIMKKVPKIVLYLTESAMIRIRVSGLSKRVNGLKPQVRGGGPPQNVNSYTCLIYIKGN